MRDIIIGSALLILFLLFVGHFSISFKPFSIALPYWNRSLGALLLIVSVIILSVGNYGKGYKDGFKAGVKFTLDEIKQLSERKSNDDGTIRGI